LEEAALLAAVLPNPQARSVKEPTTFLRERAAIIADGAKVLSGDRRAACFED
jgi:monofunctional biosynthetic peptidoglycan transglycosylase